MGVDHGGCSFSNKSVIDLSLYYLLASVCLGCEYLDCKNGMTTHLKFNTQMYGKTNSCMFHIYKPVVPYLQNLFFAIVLS
jgi:hypothetical protein